jgi:putative membrane protein
MRFFYFLILILLLAAIGMFAVQNNETVAIKYWDRSISLPISLVIGGAYLLGMLSGWTVIGFLKRSLQEVTTERRPQ